MRSSSQGRELEARGPGRTFEFVGASSPWTTMDGTFAMTLTDTMGKADFVLIDGEIFETEYLRVPDEDTLADDVVLEAKNGRVEFAWTRADLDGAEHLGEGVYQLASGHQLRFLHSATVH